MWHKREPKSRTLKKHARKRFFARHGLEFTQHIHDLFVKKILSDDMSAKFVEKQSHRVSVWDITHEGNIYRVVYDKTRKTIITTLPPECVKKK